MNIGRRLLLLLVAALMVVTMAALPALAEGQNPPTSCGVGGNASHATHQAKDFGLGGLGQATHNLGFDNVGELIQPIHENRQAVCHLD